MATLDYDDTDLPAYFRAKLHWTSGPASREASGALSDMPGYYGTDPIPPSATETPPKASEGYPEA